MVDLGQKRWKKFHLFYSNKEKKNKKAENFNFEIFCFFCLKGNRQELKDSIFS
jgi:hypothetical protein